MFTPTPSSMTIRPNPDFDFVLEHPRYRPSTPATNKKNDIILLD
jgi:hypothetical protein